jgi:hypothetical protein
MKKISYKTFSDWFYKQYEYSNNETYEKYLEKIGYQVLDIGSQDEEDI